MATHSDHINTFFLLSLSFKFHLFLLYMQYNWTKKTNLKSLFFLNKGKVGKNVLVKLTCYQKKTENLRKTTTIVSRQRHFIRWSPIQNNHFWVVPNKFDCFCGWESGVFDVSFWQIQYIFWRLYCTFLNFPFLTFF